LGYNFIQLYSNVKGDKLVTEAFWPAKLNGNVKLKTKGSAAVPKKGKLSVEISPGKEKVTVAIGSSTPDEKEPKSTPSLDKAAAKIASGKSTTSDEEIGKISRKKR
jgi:hypothetical protein